MNKQSPQEATLLEKIRLLPPDKMAEVEDFVDFLYRRGAVRRSPQSAAQDDELQQKLLKAGLVGEIKLPITDLTCYENRQPVENKGRPLSEIIIEERR